MIDPELISEIREHHRNRQDLMRAKNRLGNQIGALCRRFTGEPKKPYPKAAALQKTLLRMLRPSKRAKKPIEDEYLIEAYGLTEAWLGPFVQGYVLLEGAMNDREKMLASRAESLPVFKWVEGIHGFGATGLGQIVGECGDLSNYASPAKVWTRMCVGRRENPDGSWSNQGFVGDGGRRRASGSLITEHTDGEGRPFHWYNAERRSLLYVISESIMKAKSPDYKPLYDAKKAEYMERWGKPQMRCHLGALRYMGKRLLKDLWVEWRKP